MDKKIKERWVKALRSGEFEQGEGMLCKVGADGQRRYCCLGVLSQLAVRSRVIPKAREDEDYGDGMPMRYGADDDIHYTPKEVTEWAGLDSNNPYVGDHKLSEHNDGATPYGPLAKKNFNEIADLIEEYL